MGKAVVIASGKGGTGKTTVTAALAACLAEQGRRTLCIDADAGLKNLDLCLGLSDRAVWDFGDVLAGRCALRDAVIEHPDLPRLFFLTAPTQPLTEADVPGFLRLVDFVKSVFDDCLIDAPAGLGPGFTAAASAADRALLVAAADPSSHRDSNRVAMELRALGVTDIRLIINRVRRGILFRSKTTLDDTVDAVGAQLIGIVPEDWHVLAAAAAQKPLALQRGSASAAMERIARRLNGEKVPLETRL